MYLCTSYFYFIICILIYLHPCEFKKGIDIINKIIVKKQLIELV